MAPILTEASSSPESAVGHVRVKRFTKRSRTGCRTCRARRIKCDETPGSCTNCTSAKRVCEGYEVCRIPPARGPKKSSSPPSTLSAQANTSLVNIEQTISSKVQWKVTSDESRCLSFFQYRSVPQLVAFFDSPVWQRLILQMCYNEPAVFHAVVALGAVNQGHEIARRRLASQPTPAHRKTLQRQEKWYLFALEQKGRSFALLNKRRMSEDPYLQTVILVCCLLFVMCELLHRNIATAITHVQSGLRILNGMEIERHVCGLNLTGPSSFDESVVESFLSLQGSSVFFGTKEPLPVDQSFVFQQPYGIYLGDYAEGSCFSSLQHARKVLNPLQHTLWLFVSKCMHTDDTEKAAMYKTLQRQQHLLLTYFTRFLAVFDAFCMATYGSTPLESASLPTPRNPTERKAHRVAELTRLSVLISILSVKTALLGAAQPQPVEYTPDSIEIISAAENAMSNLKVDMNGDSLTLTPQSEIVPALFLSSVRCPDLGVRCRAIKASREWGVEEGFLSSNMCADILEEALKILLQRIYAEPDGAMEGVSFDLGECERVTAHIVYDVDREQREHVVVLERNEALVADLLAIEGSRDWPCVRALGLLDHVP
ncbi:hypothetical protein BDW74DRAFT_189228 [Aspergillus multicolor]|uniref:Zn(II)2Cys6 transcription factor domain-containing protein n=1 Tax=Aspergillus multicolor TaxID=41759 RepID=UPI003CCDBBAB